MSRDSLHCTVLQDGLRAVLDRRTFLGAATATICARSLPPLFAQIKADEDLNPKPEPDRRRLSALLHTLLVTDSPELHRFAVDTYATCVLGKIRAADPPLKHAWIVPGGGYYAQWVWDTMFVVDLLALLPG